MRQKKQEQTSPFLLSAFRRHAPRHKGDSRRISHRLMRSEDTHRNSDLIVKPNISKGKLMESFKKAHICFLSDFKLGVHNYT